MKKILQTDSSNFEEIISRNFLYIDKTEYIHKLLTAGSYYFLAHPRRFGKSLWLSTLQAVFEGKRELFKELWIDSADYDWQKYPVIFIDFVNIANKTPKIFEQALIDELQSI